MGAIIDLHIHSSMSDGSDTPQDLVNKVREAGIRFFSLTDHDTAKGCIAIAGIAAEDPELVFINGTEFSCKGEDGRKYHILGYAFSMENSPAAALIAESHANRMAKLEGRLDFLKTRYGFSFTDEEASLLRSLENPGKPHIGNLMAQKGYAASKEEAIEKYLNLYHGQENYITPERAVAAIARSGGTAVLAHPIFGNGSQSLSPEEVERRVSELKEYGLAGLESFYPSFTSRDERMLLGLAEKYGLMVTAGSDYHGTNKTGISLGQHGLTEDKMELPPVRAFIDRVMYA